MELLEYVTEQTVILRHPKLESAIRRFFADAAGNHVRAFCSDREAGYEFHVMSSQDTGRFYKFVTAEMYFGAESPERQARFMRQLTNGEWYTSAFCGRLG